jgi:phosphatidylglycerophosphate synthase
MRASIEPLARAMANVGLTANRLTLIGFGIAIVGAVLAGAQWWLLAGLVGSFGAAFDMFDGAVARVTGTAGPFGGFMDAVFDRWGEAVLYLGIVVGCTSAGYDLGAWLGAAAMGSAFMVSYTRARAESFGFSSGRGMAAVGLAPREVRTVILGLGLVIAGILGVSGTPVSTGATVLALALGLIAVLATITTVQRIVFTSRQAGR